MLNTLECVLMLRNVPKEQLARLLRRTTEHIFKYNGFFRQLNYLGLQKTPYRFCKNNESIYEANYFYSEFHIPKREIVSLRSELKRDGDVIHFNIIKQRKDEKKPKIVYEDCTFEEEMRPVPYRPQVIELVEKAHKIANEKNKRKLKLELGCDFYPFQQ